MVQFVQSITTWAHATASTESPTNATTNVVLPPYDEAWRCCNIHWKPLRRRRRQQQPLGTCLHDYDEDAQDQQEQDHTLDVRHCRYAITHGLTCAKKQLRRPLVKAFVIYVMEHGLLMPTTTMLPEMIEAHQVRQGVLCAYVCVSSCRRGCTIMCVGRPPLDCAAWMIYLSIYIAIYVFYRSANVILSHVSIAPCEAASTASIECRGRAYSSDHTWTLDTPWHGEAATGTTTAIYIYHAIK
jgi:hypothetical protein